jgi:DNA-binding transcriptional MerR regulator
VSIQIAPEMTIAEAAERSGLSAHTLRYYERIGLIHPVERDHGGHRRYGDDDLEWLVFLTRLRRTGMPIRQMVEYAELVRAGSHTIGRRREMLERHRASVRSQMAELEETLAVLERKIEMYDEIESAGTRPSRAPAAKENQ